MGFEKGGRNPNSKKEPGPGSGGRREGAGPKKKIKDSDGMIRGYKNLNPPDRNAYQQEWREKTSEVPIQLTQEEKEQKTIEERIKRGERWRLREEKKANKRETEEVAEGEALQDPRGEDEEEEREAVGRCEAQEDDYPDDLLNEEEGAQAALEEEVAPYVAEHENIGDPEPHFPAGLEEEAAVEEDPEDCEKNNNDHLVTLEETSEQGDASESFGNKYFQVYSKPDSPERTAELIALILERCNIPDSNIKSNLAVAYTRATERHFDEQGDQWECPDRTIKIHEALASAGILDVATRLEEERIATKEEFMRAHTQTLWDYLQECKEDAEKMKEKKSDTKKAKNSKKAKRLAKNEDLKNNKSLFLNEFTIPCAFLGAGSVISSVDYVVANEGVAFALPRPGRSFNFIGH